MYKDKKIHWSTQRSVFQLKEQGIHYTKMRMLYDAWLDSSSDKIPNISTFSSHKGIFEGDPTLCSWGSNSTPAGPQSSDSFNIDITFIFLPRSTPWMPFQHSDNEEHTCFGHSKCSVPASWHAHIMVLSTAELCWQSRFPWSTSYTTSDTAYTLHYAEPFVNSFVFPIRHTANIHQAALCGGGASAKQAERILCYSLCTDKPREFCQVSRCLREKGKAPTQVIQFGICINSSSHLQSYHTSEAGEGRGSKEEKGEESVCVYFTICIYTF